MKKITTHLRYDGEALKDHAIDIDVLGRSLVSLSNLIQEAAKSAYGDNKKVRVNVSANVEQNCFEVLLIFDGLVDAARTLFKSDEADELKNILEWVGIFGCGGYGIFQMIKKYKGKRIRQEDIAEKSDKGITLEGGIHIDNRVFNMYDNSKVIHHTQGFLKPLGRNGIDEIVFSSDGEEDTKITSQEYGDFVDADLSGEEYQEQTDTIKNVVERNLVVYKPELSNDAKKWSFYMNGHAINVDITNTGIANDAIHRGEIRVGDTYRVKMEEQEYRTATGQYRIRYKIIEVLEFKRGAAQPEIKYE